MTEIDRQIDGNDTEIYTFWISIWGQTNLTKASIIPYMKKKIRRIQKDMVI